MNTNQNKQSYALPIMMMFLLFFIISFVTGLQNPMAGILKDQFHLSGAIAQLANGAVFLAYLFMGIPAGKMLEKIGYKKSALIALITGFIGVLILFLAGKVESFPIYLFGAFISGFSMCILNAVVNPMLSVLGSEEGANSRLNFGGALNSLGGTLAPVLGGLVIGGIAHPHISDANPLLYLAMGIFALVFLVLSMVQIPEPHITVASTEKNTHSPLSFRHFVLGMVAIFLYVGVEVSLANNTNQYLSTYSIEKANATINEYKKQQSDITYLNQLKNEDELNKDVKKYKSKIIDEKMYETAEKISSKDSASGLGMDAGIAGSIVGTYWLLMLVGRLSGGFLGKKFTSKQMLTAVSTTAIAFVLISIFTSNSSVMASLPAFSSETLSFVMTPVPLNILFLVLCGLCLSVMWPGIFNLATNGLGKYTAQGSGFFMTMVVGGGILPFLQAYVVDITGGFPASYWVVVAGLGYILFYALVGSKNVNKDIKVD